ncbi:hypothetical protein I7I50_03413 [Histoplasma capsulatum G186AR]|uniref:Uncharacterized protein n=1 Tax=Ajellomyces capsulatus TaxID=5037 RepID=A0A8H7YPB9_AJECA|nr:hypothetical protein I7I52_04320 [Histoplasma capsulatum]QSS74564.1 hypothetical protein I7I50_03413 [Histoplasma capsulatum G186AR]
MLGVSRSNEGGGKASVVCPIFPRMKIGCTVSTSKYWFHGQGRSKPSSAGITVYIYMPNTVPYSLTPSIYYIFFIFVSFLCFVLCFPSFPYIALCHFVEKQSRKRDKKWKYPQACRRA